MNTIKAVLEEKQRDLADRGKWIQVRRQNKCKNVTFWILEC